MPAQNVTLTEEMTSRVNQRVLSGKFSSPTEVLYAALNALELMEQEESKFAELRAAIDEGLESGVAEGTIDDVFARVRERAGLGLPLR